MEDEEIKKLLLSTKREDMENMIGWMENNQYFTSPASTRFHNAFVGGLKEHCVEVYEMLTSLVKLTGANIPLDSQIICSLLHDNCKGGLYFMNTKGKWSYDMVKVKLGHASLSLKIISQFIKLTPLEIELIRLHMGPWGAVGIARSPEYKFSDWERCSAEARLFHYADDIACKFGKVKK